MYWQNKIQEKLEKEKYEIAINNSNYSIQTKDNLKYLLHTARDIREFQKLMLFYFSQKGI